ncbi:MAG: hypothetical protein JNM66_06145 [Bryobacterales bacterium]|nr:hypothetical protein [Bryobacterales bacterium]
MIKYRLLNSGEVVVAADYRNPAGSRPAMNSITSGGTADLTGDGWWAFSNQRVVCAVDLNGLTRMSQESHTYCSDTSYVGVKEIDYVQVTQVDKGSRKRYLVVLSAPRGHVFGIANNILSYDYALPSGPGEIAIEPHSDVTEDSNGNQILFWNYYDPYSNRYALASGMLNKRELISRPVEENGGLRLLYPTDSGNWMVDAHFGCNWAGLCTYTPYGSVGTLKAPSISSIQQGPSCVAKTIGAHELATGDPILIAGAKGVTSINGPSTVTVLSSTSFSINGRSCGGNYESNSASVVRNIQKAAPLPFRDEIIISRPGHEFRRIAVHRARLYENNVNLTPYYQSPKATLSPDGRFVAFISNMGLPENASVWIGTTGISSSSRVVVQSIPTPSNRWTIGYKVPAGEFTAQVVISTEPDLSNPIYRNGDGQVSEIRALQLPSLLSGKRYYYRISTGKYSTTGDFGTSEVTINRLRP